MTEDKQRIEIAKWVFERTLSWIATADAKVAVAVAIDSAMLGGLAAAFSGSDYHLRTAWCYFFVVVATAGLVLAIFCAGMAAIPRMFGPVKSMIFFVRIADRKEGDFVADFSKMTEQDFLADLATQIHRNSQIARDKHQWVRRSLIWSFLATAFWIAAIAMLVKV